MKRILPTISIFCFLLTSACAQNKKSIKSINAFYSVSIPGMQRVDENGNKINPLPTITRFLYVEAKGKVKPFFDTISYNGSLFTSNVLVDSNKIKVGISRKDGTPILLQAQKGNAIWRVDLQPLNEIQKKTAINATNIIIKGKVEKTTFKIILKNEIELSTPDMY